MAKKRKNPIEEITRREDGATEALEPLENFEIENLNADSLDIEELEARLEMATTFGDLGVYCGADCGTFCGVDDCTNLCVGLCTTLCGVDGCGADCGVDGCVENTCDSRVEEDAPFCDEEV